MAKKATPRLHELPPRLGGGITKPRTNCFGHLFTVACRLAPFLSCRNRRVLLNYRFHTDNFSLHENFTRPFLRFIVFRLLEEEEEEEEEDVDRMMACCCVSDSGPYS